MSPEMSDQEYIAENFHHLANTLTDEKELQAYQNLAPFFTGTEKQITALHQVGEKTGDRIFTNLADNLQRAINQAVHALAVKISEVVADGQGDDS